MRRCVGSARGRRRSAGVSFPIRRGRRATAACGRLCRKPRWTPQARSAQPLHSVIPPTAIRTSVQVTRILAVRHGETAWNRDTRIQGHTDIALSDKGRWQAERLALALRDEPIAAFYASDLSRAFETAATSARAHGKPVQAHRGLRERAFGRFEGLTWAEIEAHHPQEAVAWRKRVPDFAPAGGEHERA